MIRALTVILIGSFVCAAHARAEMRPGALQSGAPIAAVIRAWGGPAEKIEHETARISEWIYPFGRVTFANGKVERWQTDLEEAGGVERKRVVLPPLTPGHPGGPSPETQQVLREILSELPSAPDSPSGAEPGVPGGAPPMLNPITPMPLDKFQPNGAPIP